VTNRPPRIVHLVADQRWQEVVASGAPTYVPDRYEADGFIHLSAVTQVVTPANALFVGRTDMVALVVDVASVNQHLVWEPGDGTNEIFPHLYAPLPVTSVVAVVPFGCDPDGRFTVSEELLACTAGEEFSG